jgi:hypothetical protein
MNILEILLFILFILGIILLFDFIILSNHDLLAKFWIKHSKYKIVERICRDGSSSFVVKYKVLLLWHVDSIDYGFYSLRTIYKSMKEAQGHVAKRIVEKKQYRDKEIIDKKQYKL